MILTKLPFCAAEITKLRVSLFFHLMQKNLIEIKNDAKTAVLRRNPSQTNQIRLNQVEEIALDWIGTSRNIKEIFQKNGLVTQLESLRSILRNAARTSANARRRRSRDRNFRR